MRRRPAITALAAVAALTLAGCATAPEQARDTGRLRVVASAAVWGDLAGQVGGEHADVRAIIDNPAADPHDYEPTTADARRVAQADVLIVNGAGYDAWATRLADASPRKGRRVVVAADVAGVPDGGNPHVWYSARVVREVVASIAQAFADADPQHAADYTAQRDALLSTGLKEYLDLAAAIRQDYAGTPIGATESIVEPLAKDLGLRVLTPAALLAAMSEGADPTVADRDSAQRQLRGRQVRVFLYNSQNSTPDVAALVTVAKESGVPVVTITETPTPAGTRFQDWQARQLRELQKALQA